MPSTPDLSRELIANPPSTRNHAWKRRAVGHTQSDVTDRMIEKRNLADLSKRFSYSGSPAPRDRLRATLQGYRIFTCNATMCEKPLALHKLPIKKPSGFEAIVQDNEVRAVKWISTQPPRGISLIGSIRRPYKAPDRSKLGFRQLEKTSKADLEAAPLRCFSYWLYRILSWTGDLMQPSSESAIEADSNSSGFQLDMKAFSGPALSPLRLSSDVAGTAAFSLLVQSQRHVSRHRISEGRHVTIIEEEGARPLTRDAAMLLPVPQAREVLVEGSMKR
ncbi:hypothetical protein EPUS_08385 [Endocarpon pusillum Z07020]|uniref:Uncharacterized protein n=1 Tax=Endocarpon pusillum (strain Z07020 / HMAS-L-300199) TaxID=1263415 RepID=U1HFY8_ENDPU|nr:uncharacterized protein EPUS_08385 [Endocarpon pusillum Z07020]ERF69035.1 hypothetical protein EPUS_08385 [Endocarpon pusillum Z07020]